MLSLATRLLDTRQIAVFSLCSRKDVLMWMTAPFHNLQASFRHYCIKSVIIAAFLGFSVLVFHLSWQDILMWIEILL